MYKSKGLKYVSIQQVKDYFIENKFATKNEIAETTHLSLATITNILKELLISHYIEQVDDCPSTGGRKSKQYKICGQFMTFGLLALHVEKATMIVSYQIIDLDFVVLETRQHHFQKFDTKTITDVIAEMKEHHDFQYLAISIPAIVKDGYIQKSDIVGLEDIPLKQQLEDLCQIQVIIENDVNTGMIGYIHTQSVESSSVAFVYQPDNHHSGCGLYINHAILYGATHFAGELAYLPNGTLYEQEIILKNDPLTLLIKQVASLIAIINPSLMIMYTPCVLETEFLIRIKEFIPATHLPLFQFINNMETYVFKGLSCLCIESSRYPGKREENGKLY